MQQKQLKSVTLHRMAYNIPPDENQELNEPQAAYNTKGKKRVRFFSSFQEQEDEMISYWASITPLQRLRHLHEMVIASFGLTEEKLKHPNLSRSLKIISYKL
jgi:hypothetical protein